MNIPLAIFDLSPTTMLFVAVVAVLLFGERLPEVAQSFGRQFKEFRNSLQGIQNEFRAAATSATSAVKEAVSSSDSPSHAGGGESEVHEEATAPKFVPPPAESHDETVQK